MRFSRRLIFLFLLVLLYKPGALPAVAGTVAPAPEGAAPIVVLDDLLPGKVKACTVPVAHCRPRVTAAAAVLVDAATGQVLYARNAYQPRPPASTTKIMTTLLALEGGRLDQTVTVSPKAAAVGESSLHLAAGERLTLEQLVYGALLRSGNDACVAIAEHIAGSEVNFVRLMNIKAVELGARQTNFVNPHGLPAAGHRSSAYDLALLAGYALRNPVFAAIVATRGKAITMPQAEKYLNNTNRLLWSYPGADGVKTGTTSEAGLCLVASATREGRQLIAVVLNSTDRYGDSIALLDYGFGHFQHICPFPAGTPVATVKVREGTAATVDLMTEKNLVVAVPRETPPVLAECLDTVPELRAPVPQGWPAGMLAVQVGDEVVAATRLVSARAVPRAGIPLRLWNVLLTGRQY